MVWLPHLQVSFEGGRARSEHKARPVVVTQQTPTVFVRGDAMRSRNVGPVTYFCKVQFEDVRGGCQACRLVRLLGVDENVLVLVRM